METSGIQNESEEDIIAYGTFTSIMHVLCSVLVLTVNNELFVFDDELNDLVVVVVVVVVVCDDSTALGSSQPIKIGINDMHRLTSHTKNTAEKTFL